MKKYQNLLKKIFSLVIILLIIFSPSVKANDSVALDKINIKFFYSDTCRHCHEEREFLKKLETKYEGKILIYDYEISSEGVDELLFSTRESLGLSKSLAVPFTYIEGTYFIGYNSAVGRRIENTVVKLIEEKQPDYFEEEKQKEKPSEEKEKSYKLPIIGDVDVTKVSLAGITLLLGFIDGFNPCALWVLLFIINILIGMKNKKKMLFLGYSFLLTSAIVYFLAMLGISFIVSFAMISKIRITIGLIAVILGLYNIYAYLKTKDETGCEVVDDEKRKSISNRVKKIRNSSSLIGAFLGIVVLAVGVNLIELTCSLGFPTIFAEILAINKVTGTSRILYLLLYVFMYMLDDLVIFTIAVLTYKVTAGTTKYGKIAKLIGGIIMILIGLLLAFKPEWIMLNF